MVFNEDILYLHIGKTGGMSTTIFLCENLTGNVFNVTPTKAKDKFGKAINVDGQRHATLLEAKSFLKENYKRGLKDFKYIVAGLRHPYDLEISLFSHLRKKYLKKDLHSEIKINSVKDNSFDQFLKANLYHRLNTPYEDYVSINERVPKKLRYIRFENIDADLNKLISDLGYSIKVKLPHRNKSKRDFDVSDLTESQKTIIQNKYRWIFDQKLYEI